MSYWQTSNYTRNQTNKKCLLKPFGYKVMTIISLMVTVSRLEKTPWVLIA